jgi:ADP-heptose:LPS heptosyltransferase
LRRSLRLLADIRSARYDLVVDMHGQARTALLVLASGAPVRVGFSLTREGAKYSYTHHIPVPSMDFHAIDRNLWLGDLLGFPTDRPDTTIYTPPEAEGEAEAALAAAGFAGSPFAIVFPGTQWETKHWPAERFVEACRHLAERGLKILLAGAGRDQPANEAVARAFPEAIDICGQTSLSGLAAIMRRANICVTNDSGPMHMAAALGLPLVSVFGPTSPVRTGPYGRPDAVVRTGIACSPCYIRKRRDCPHELRCMTELSSGAVIARIDAALAEGERRARASTDAATRAEAPGR